MTTAATADLTALDVQPYALRDTARVLTPALLIYRERVAHNIATTLRLLGGDAARWRPHVKTAKLAYTMRLLTEAGVTSFKCATTLELATAIAAGARDVLLAYPVVAANAQRVQAIAAEHSDVVVSALIDNDAALEVWRGSPVGIFLDINPGMDRTGIAQLRQQDIVDLARAVASAGLKFRGLHYYDGHLSNFDLDERTQRATGGYEQLMKLIAACEAAGIAVEEVITAGTPAFPCSLAFRPLRTAVFRHRVSPGTVVYSDATSLAQLPPEWAYAPAAVVMARVVSHPAPDVVTCDAGHKTVSADAGVPTCVVLGHPELTPLKPSEEHLPLRVASGAKPPHVGDLLYLVPRHICPSVNNFDHALIIANGAIASMESVTARGREKPLL